MTPGKITVRLRDARGQRLDLTLERRGSTWRVSALHSVEGRGATTTHPSERGAKQAFDRLVTAARAVGWVLTSGRLGQLEAPAPMERDAFGERLFRDRRTGQLVRDESASRPLGAPPVRTGADDPRPAPERPGVDRARDLWSLGALPASGLAEPGASLGPVES